MHLEEATYCQQLPVDMWRHAVADKAVDQIQAESAADSGSREVKIKKYTASGAFKALSVCLSESVAVQMELGAGREGRRAYAASKAGTEAEADADNFAMARITAEAASGINVRPSINLTCCLDDFEWKTWVTEPPPPARRNGAFLDRALAGRPTDAKRPKRTAHGNTLPCHGGGIVPPCPL